MEKTKLVFFDDYWLDFRTGTVRRWFDPERIGEFCDPKLLGGSGANTFYDKEQDQYLVQYWASDDVGQDEKRMPAMVSTKDFKTFQPVILKPDAPEGRKHIIRECDDGISMDCITLDRAEPDEAKRYKATALYFPDGIKDFANIKMVGCYSPDCINWTVDTDNYLHHTTSDADNNIIWNPVTQEYMLFFRAGYVDRRICCKTSKDLKTWSDAVVTVHPGAWYNNEAYQVQLYGMVPTYSNGVFYAMMQIFYTSLTDMDFTKMWGYVETELYYSYDGYHYMPTSGKAIVPRPQAPAYGCTQMYLMHLCDTADGHDYIISGSGARVIHGTGESNKMLSDELKGEAFGSCFYKIRKDGFCGIEGMGIGAQVITKCIQLLDPEISINVNASCGFIRYGLMKKYGEFYDGFSFDDCEVLKFGESVDYKLRWKNADPATLVGEQVRLAVELNGAILFSATFEGRPCIRRPQTSFSNPNQLL